MAKVDFTVDMSGLEGMTADNTEGTFTYYGDNETYGRISFTCIVTVDSGKVVTQPPEVVAYYVVDGVTSRVRREGTLQADGTYKITLNSAVTPYGNTYKMGGAEVTGRAISNEIMSKYGFIGAYLAEKADIVALSRIRFYVDSSGDSTERVDLGKYILSYVHYPFEVDTDNTADVVLGFYQSNVNCALLSTQYKNLVLFDGVINGKYENETDINNVDIKVKLPYCDVYTLSSDCINKHIKISYQIDLLSNDCLITIEREGEIIDTLTATVGYEEPFITKDSSVEQTFTNKMNSNPNKRYKGGVLVYQKENPTPDRIAVRIRKTVGDLSGFVRGNFDSFKSDGDMSATEIEMIRSAFNEGVIL